MTTAEYKPFYEGTRPWLMWIQKTPRHPPAAPGYSCLRKVLTDRRSIIMLQYDDLFRGPYVIEIQGDYLAPLADAFQRHAVMWVLEFDPELFTALPKGTPLVREISITYESWKKGSRRVDSPPGLP